jgi:hypothetical protein
MSEADPKFGSALKDDWTFGPIFDADAHIDPPYEMWKDYLPQSQKHKAPVIEEGDENDWLVFEGTRRPIHMMSNQAGREGKDFKMKGKLSDMRNTHDPDKRIADMDLDGIDQAILFGGGPLGSFDNDLYLASFEAFSRWVMDWASIAPHRLFPVGHAPMRDIDETIEHVKRLAKMGFKMLQLPAFPQNPKPGARLLASRRSRKARSRRRPVIPRAPSSTTSQSSTSCGRCCATTAWSSPSISARACRGSATSSTSCPTCR